MIAILTTTDPVKLSAVEALLRDAGVESTVFDRAAGTLWTSVIPLRLMIADTEEARARCAMGEAGWSDAEDGEWDYVENRGLRIDGTLA